MNTPSLRAILLPTFALVLVCAPRAEVLVVAAGGGGDFSDLPGAVGAAQNGDVLLVKSGLYQGFALSGGSLSIVADEGATVLVRGNVDLANLTGAQRVLLAGLDVDAFATVATYVDSSALRITSSGGAVRLQDCTFSGGNGQDAFCYFGHYPEYDGGAGARIVGSGKIVFTRCTLAGGSGGEQPFSGGCFDDFGGIGGPGLEDQASQVTLYDSTLLGGPGGQAGIVGGDGGHGARATAGSALFLGSTSSTGGNGSTPWDIVAFQDGNGGDGLRIEAGAVAFLADADLAGGGLSGGFSVAMNHIPGSPLAGPGVVTDYGVEPPRLTAPNVVREGGAVTVTISGTPGSALFLLRSHTPSAALNTNQTGVKCVVGQSDLPHAILGPLPASGTKTFALSVPLLARGVEHDTVYWQVVAQDPSVGHSVLGTPHTLTVLDAGF